MILFCGLKVDSKDVIVFEEFAPLYSTHKKYFCPPSLDVVLFVYMTNVKRVVVPDCTIECSGTRNTEAPLYCLDIAFLGALVVI